MRGVIAVGVLWLALASGVQAQSAQWFPGLDILIPAYVALDSKGDPKPPTHVLGFDRDTRHASLLDLTRGCATHWTWPTTGGAVTQIVQLSIDRFMLYFETGIVSVRVMPAGLPCVTLPPPPISFP